MDYSSVRARVSMISPETAQSMLDRNVGNRKLRRHVFEKYALDMRNGKWITTPDGIGVDVNGVLLNGQHRLHAVIHCGLPVEFLIVEGLDPSAFKMIDRPLRRTIAENSGSSPSLVAAINRAYSSMRSINTLSDGEQMAALNVHDVALRFVAESVPNVRGISNSSVRGAFLRAWYHVDEGTLMHILDVLYDRINVFIERDRPVRLLREILLETSRSGTGAVISKYKKTERVIKAYVDEEPLTKIYETKKELFPFPDSVISLV